MSPKQRAPAPATEGAAPPGFAARMWLLAAIAVVCLAAGYFASQRLWGTAGKTGADAGEVVPAAPPPEWGSAFAIDASPEVIKGEALRVADEMDQGFPDNLDALQLRARLQFNLGQFDDAVKNWRKCLELDGKVADACYGIGYVAAKQGDHEQAVAMYGRALALAPEDVRVPPLLAEELLKLGRFQDAAVLLELHLRGPVASPLALLDLGKAYLQLQRYDDAKKVYEAAAKFDDTRKEALYGLATACSRLGRDEEAKRYREQFAALDAKHMQAHSQRLKDFADADATRELLAKVHLDAGQLYRKQGQDEKAEGMLRKAAFLAPKDLDSRKALMAIYEGAGRERSALAICRQLRELEPKNGDHWLNVGLLSARLGDYEEAVAAAGQAVELDPANPQYRKAYEMILKGK